MHAAHCPSHPTRFLTLRSHASARPERRGLCRESLREASKCFHNLTARFLQGAAVVDNFIDETQFIGDGWLGSKTRPGLLDGEMVSCHQPRELLLLRANHQPLALTQRPRASPSSLTASIMAMPPALTLASSFFKACPTAGCTIRSSRRIAPAF